MTVQTIETTGLKPRRLPDGKALPAPGPFAPGENTAQGGVFGALSTGLLVLYPLFASAGVVVASILLIGSGSGA